MSDFSNFMGAVIDESSFKTQKEAIEEAQPHAKSSVVVGGGVDDSEGYFVEPTVIETEDPNFRLLRDELFGPVVTAYVYPEKKWDETLDLVDKTAPYGLTGAIFSDDRLALVDAEEKLRYAAGNLYLNDKPTGAVVGAAAVRRLTRLGHERQGRLDVEPHPLGEPAHDQGDVHPADGLPLSVPRGRRRQRLTPPRDAAAPDPRRQSR